MKTPEIGPVRTPRPTSEEDLKRRWTLALLLAFPLLYAGLGQLLRQDVDWDLQNYHFFDSYWVLVNHMRDVTPAQLQTYLSPVLDIPFYFAARHFPPRLTGCLFAVIQGTAFPLLYLINRHFTRRRLVALGLAGLGMFAAGALSELGTIIGDTLVAPVFFAAILLGLRSLDATRAEAGKRISPPVLVAGACVLAGLAAGLKLSELPVAVGIAVAFPLISGTIAERLRRAIWASAGLILGLLISYGWWGYELASRYGNPILPYMNQIFHSAYVPFAPNTDLTWKTHGLVDFLFYPFVWTLHPTRVSEVPFLEASLPILEALLIILLAIVVSKTLIQRRYIKVFNNDKQRYLVVVAIVSYVLWGLQFGYYRYFLPIEMLSFTLIFICLQAISTQIGWKSLVRVGTIVIVLVCIISEKPANWGRSAWASNYFGVSIPKSLVIRPAAFLMLGSNPDGFVVPYFPRQDYFAQIDGNLPPTPYLKTIIGKDISAYRDTYTIWEDPVSLSRSAFSYTAQAQIESYGFHIDWDACVRFPASVGSLPEEFHACRLTRTSRSNLAPLTRMLRPASGDQVMGQQYLAASAFAAAGVSKVEFSIVGEGHTVDTGATIFPYGWLGAWNTVSVPNGLYTVRSVAYSVNGLVTESAGVVVDVKN